jgi:hypothetical protein
MKLELEKPFEVPNPEKIIMPKPEHYPEKPVLPAERPETIPQEDPVEKRTKEIQRPKNH